jgi:POT family proton-dependent oligopeptide transporter
MALFARAAPPRAAGVMMGVAQFAIFIGSTVSGRLGALYSSWSTTDFWLLHAGICAAGGLAFVLLARPLRHVLRGN